MPNDLKGSISQLGTSVRGVLNLRAPKDEVALQAVDGLLTWTQPIDAFHLRFRHIRKATNAMLHIILVLISIATLIAFGFRLVQQQEIAAIFTGGFWLAGYPEVAWFWTGIFLDCFIVFRLFEYSNQAKVIPGWGKGAAWAKAREASANERKNVQFEVSPYFAEDAWETIDGAHQLASRLKKSEISVAHVFASCLASVTGGRFLTRIGLPFEKTKDPISALIRRGESLKAGTPELSKSVKKIFLAAYEDARKEQRKYVRTIELFSECVKQSPDLQELFISLGYPSEHVLHVAEWIQLREALREDRDRFIMLAQLKPNTAMNRSMTARATPLLDRFSEDLTRAARNGYLPAIVGRKTEMEELLRAIESGDRSVILVGPRGTGKHALVEGLARRMVEEDVPEELFDRRLVAINIPQVISAGDPSLASERFFSILEEVSLSGNIIPVLEGIEALTGGMGSGPLDLAEGLATQLGHGNFLVIGTTTPDAYTKYLERRTLGSKLVRVDVPEMEPDEAIRAIMARCGAIEYKQQVYFTFAAIERAVTFSDRYIHDRALPAKALDLIREAAVLARKARGENALVGGEDVALVVHEKTQIPVEAVSQDESKKLLGLEERLHGRVIGQDDAVTAVSQAMRRARAELREGKRPIANFLFLGPTGVGKTETAKALAAVYFGDESSMIRIDMSEYQEAGSVDRMIGAPGDERGGLLTESVRKQPFAIVLLDEIEKAHPDILNLFLQVMDDGRLTDGVGRTIDFTNVVLIATSNAGTQFIQDEVKQGTDLEHIKVMLLEKELKGLFRPEFLNRFDAMIVFKPLTMDDVEQITWLMLRQIEKQLDGRGMKFRAEDAAVEELARIGFDPLFGARPLRRVIQDKVENQLADLLLRGQVARRDTVVLSEDGILRVEKAKAIGS
jgi:ATP-dependent Clp protease ATP-binding subunit ClpC